MMKYPVLLTTLLLTILLNFGSASSAFAQQNSAVFTTVGNPYPAAPTSISMEREIVYLAELDTMATWRFLYEFANNGTAAASSEMITPVVIYFDDFRQGSRSPMLEKLAELFPDLFAVDESINNIAPALQQKFGNRLFVKRYVSQVNLAKAGLAYSLQLDEENKAVSKIALEFRWERKPAQPPALKMTIHFHSGLSIPTGESIEVVARLKLPAAVRNEKPYHYTTLELGGPENWAGQINNLYLVNRLDGTRPLLPRGLTPDQKMSGKDHIVSSLKNVKPIGLRMAFYKEETSPGAYYVPIGVSAINASSSLLQTTGQPARQTLARFAVTERVLDPEIRAGLSNNYPSWTPYLFEPHQLGESLRAQEANGMAEAAFDHSPAVDDKTISREYLSTAWCENAKGDGKGEWLSFELLQPVRATYMENGDLSSKEAYAANGRLRSFRVKAVDGSFEKLYPVNDIGLLNTYYDELRPGAYTMELITVFPGESGKTCLSSIAFDFLTGDKWFDQRFIDL